MALTRLQFLLTKLAEEAAEVGQRALKAQQFGLDEGEPGQDETNRQRLHRELHDLISVAIILNSEFEFGYRSPMVETIQAKRAKINKYYDYSAMLGYVEQPS